MITGLSDEFTNDLILEKKSIFSLLILFLSIDIEPTFDKYHPKIGIFNNSFFKINTGELKTVCKKKFQT